MSDVRVPEVYSGITNICKRPKNFDFPETVQSFRFVGLKSFHGFIILDGTMGSPCLPWVLFGHKNVGSSSLENLYKKTCRTWPGALKTFKKTSKCSKENTQKGSNIILYIFRWINIVSYPLPPFYEGGGIKFS